MKKAEARRIALNKIDLSFEGLCEALTDPSCAKNRSTIFSFRYMYLDGLVDAYLSVDIITFEEWLFIKDATSAVDSAKWD